jgi:hypothetical protein
LWVVLLKALRLRTFSLEAFMATAHLSHGFLGVGKTTLARRLEKDIPAIRFSHDE